jgi:hypothetical protein
MVNVLNQLVEILLKLLLLPPLLPPFTENGVRFKKNYRKTLALDLGVYKFTHDIYTYNNSLVTRMGVAYSRVVSGLVPPIHEIEKKCVALGNNCVIAVISAQSSSVKTNSRIKLSLF